jgi:putative ABC transport system ATP-binding protein
VTELELRDVVKHYPGAGEEIRAVDGISLTVRAGQLVALYGPSGSGKTTLLQLAGGLLSPDAGTITFGGQDVTDMDAKKSTLFRRYEVGFVLQQWDLNPAASAEDNASINLLSRGLTLKESNALARPWLERLGLSHRLKHRAELLSMGERQRVALARALAGKPHLLLTDEPTGNLDAQRTVEILELVRDLCHSEHIPGVIVTHDAAALDSVDEVYVLRNGRLSDDGDSPRTAAVRS